MNYNPDIHNRRSIRLKGYDYSQCGWYFITICTHSRRKLIGEIVNGVMKLNKYGKIVQFVWDDLPNHTHHIQLDEFVIMPDHIHGIIGININECVGVGLPNHGLPEIVRQFKTFSALGINKIRNTIGTPVWQRNYYEHIIRNENDLRRIIKYIKNNPGCWDNGV